MAIPFLVTSQESKSAKVKQTSFCVLFSPVVLGHHQFKVQQNEYSLSLTLYNNTT